MKKYFVIMIVMAAWLSAANTITTGTLGTAVASGGGAGAEYKTYRIDIEHYYRGNLLISYVLGNSTNITVTLGYTYAATGITAATVYTGSFVDATTSVAANDAIVLDATANRMHLVNMPKRAKYIYITVLFSGGTTGTALVDFVIDYNM